MIVEGFFKFHDFSMHGTFFSDFPGFSMIFKACGEPEKRSDSSCALSVGLIQFNQKIQSISQILTLIAYLANG